LKNYEFWVRKGRHIAAINTADLREASSGGAPRYQLSLILAESMLRDIASVELARFDGDLSTTITSWTKGDGQVFITLLNSTGADIGPPQSVVFPFQVNGLVRVALRTDRFPRGFQVDHAVVYLRDSSGKRIAEARFAQ